MNGYSIGAPQNYNIIKGQVGAKSDFQGAGRTQISREASVSDLLLQQSRLSKLVWFPFICKAKNEGNTGQEGHGSQIENHERHEVSDEGQGGQSPNCPSMKCLMHSAHHHQHH